MTVSSAAGTSKISNAWKIFAVILFVNIIQSAFSLLLNDEPYYWLWSRYLSWGYFDHPPMVALLIRIGSTLLPGEIGIRALGLILGSFTFFLVYRLIEAETDKPVNYKLIALLLFSSLFLNMYSFLAIPDTPLLFFAALFLYTYRRYLQIDNLLNSLLLGTVTALLLYSKYHGVLLVGFTVLSNLKLLGRRSFYMVFVMVVVLLVPHIYWQVQHDYPTIRFQLLERTNAFGFDHVFSYLGEQAAVTGPVILLLFSILYKPKNQFQKTLKFNVCGVFAFFLISSFKEMINLHWTAIAWPSMLCLAYLYISDLKRQRPQISWLLVFNLLIVLVMRVNFIFNFLRIPNFNDRNPKVMTSVLSGRAGGQPVVFKDMYNEPAYYMYYGHQHSYAVNNIWYKKTQFNYLPQLENEFQGKTVSMVSPDSLNASSKPVTITKGKKYFLTAIPHFASFNTGIKVNAADFKYLNASSQSKVTLSVTGNSLDSVSAHLFTQKHGYLALYMINKKTNMSAAFRYNARFDLTSKNPFDLTFKAPAGKGAYTCIFSLVTTDGFLVGFNSNVYNVEVR